jgi:hypothetical protein
LAVDFCVDPGNAVNNPNAEAYRCRHECEVLDSQAAEATGCNNNHEDAVCEEYCENEVCEEYCYFECNGVVCDAHESETACEDANAVWDSLGTCEEVITVQPQMAVDLVEWPTEMVASYWLALYGSSCCTGYEIPGVGSCDSGQDLYVSSMALCTYGLGVDAAVSDAVPCAPMPTE